jgi:hypothetical protein
MPPDVRLDGEIEDPNDRGQEEADAEAADDQHQLAPDLGDVVASQKPAAELGGERERGQAPRSLAVAASEEQVAPRQQQGGGGHDEEDRDREAAGRALARAEAGRLHALGPRPLPDQLKENGLAAVGGGLHAQGQLGTSRVRSHPGRARVAVEGRRPEGRDGLEAPGLQARLREERRPVHGSRGRGRFLLALRRRRVEADQASPGGPARLPTSRTT